ncbi:MAG TPA: 4Fe-4S binding protein, partial [Deltaproteobacteria bacterium]|nr:4Fe-4S binding protein [Deltaproteobacteria bacterium]
MKRKIIEIDEALCNGCGNCITACAEGALQLIEGKARLVSDVYCDGLGACIGECPTGALTVVEREAPAFDEEAAARHVKEGKEEKETGNIGTLACGCPGAAAMTFDTGDAPADTVSARSALSHFPVKLQLIHPQAPYLKGADLLLMADCCALCYPGLHQNLLRGKAVAMGCPKLDDLNAHIGKLVQIVRSGGIRSITVVHMEV